MSFYSQSELEALGLARVGKDVLLSRKASIYGAARIEIGDNTRIDDFCVLSAGAGGISIGNHVHIAVFTLLIGQGHIKIMDFANLSSRVAVYSSNDDYSGAFMTGPTVPEQFLNVTRAPVSIGRHAIIGSGSVVLPGVAVGDGVAIGALSLVNEDCVPFGMYAGTPARHLKDRKRDLLRLEQEFLAQKSASE